MHAFTSIRYAEGFQLFNTDSIEIGANKNFFPIRLFCRNSPLLDGQFYGGRSVTGLLVLVALAVKKHYARTAQLLTRLDSLVMPVVQPEFDRKNLKSKSPNPECNSNAMTAVIFVSGFNGLGLHTLFGILRLFGDIYKNFVFVQMGTIAAGNFKGVEDLESLEEKTREDVNKYVAYMKHNGFYAEGFYATGIDIIDEILQLSPAITKRFPQSVFSAVSSSFRKIPC